MLVKLAQSWPMSARSKARGRRSMRSLSETPRPIKRNPKIKVSRSNQAADGLKAHREAQAEYVEKTAELGDAIAVDIERADKLHGGVLPQDDPSAPQLEQDPATAIPGLDPEVERAMKLPQVRQAIEEKISHATKAEGDFRQATETVYHAAVASIAAVFPGLTGIPPHQIEQRLQQMRQTDPVRFNQAVSALQKAAAFENALTQNKQREAQNQQAQFERDARSHDEKFEKAIGQRTPQQRQAVANEMFVYAAEMGIDRATLLNLLQNNPIMRHWGFQKTIHDATEARIMRRNGETYRQNLDRSVPPVQRPGTRSGSGAGAGRGGELLALSNKFTKNPDLKSAAALLAASRRK